MCPVIAFVQQQGGKEEPMAERVNEIEIIGVDREGVRSEPPFVWYPFILSSQPDSDWAAIFDHTYQHLMIDSGRLPARLEDSRILVRMTPDDNLQGQLDTYKQLVRAVNEEYASFESRGHE